MELNTSTEFGARVAQRLSTEEVIWLTTVTAAGTPQPNPVWFYWDVRAFLILTQPESYKVRNLQHNPRVSLHFNTDEDGGDVVVVIGEAFIDTQPIPVDTWERYLEKYRQGIADIGLTPQSMADSYNVSIRVKPYKIRGF